MLATLREMGEKEGVKFNEEQYQKSLPLIKTQLKALIARDLWEYERIFPGDEYDETKVYRRRWRFSIRRNIRRNLRAN